MISVHNLKDNSDSLYKYITDLNNYLNLFKVDYSKIPSSDTDSEDYENDDDLNIISVNIRFLDSREQNLSGICIYSLLVNNDLENFKKDIERYKKRDCYIVLKRFFDILENNLKNEYSVFHKTKYAVIFVIETNEGEFFPVFIDDTSVKMIINCEKFGKTIKTQDYISDVEHQICNNECDKKVDDYTYLENCVLS